MKTLMATQVLFWLLRAPDGHAKNFSIQLLPRDRFQLTPLYDVMSVYPVLGNASNQWSPYDIKLAMALLLLGKNRHSSVGPSTAQRRRSAMPRSPSRSSKKSLHGLQKPFAQVQAGLPQNFSPRVRDAILGGLEQAA